MGLYITDYTGDPANLGTNFAYGGGSSTLPADLSETIDDRVAEFLRVGAGLTKTHDDAGNTLTISAIPPLPSIRQLVSIQEGLILEPISTGIVACEQYWPGTTDVGVGGLFVATKGTVDNVINFESPTIGTVWRRVNDVRSIENAGCIKAKVKLEKSQNPLTNYATMPLLSSKFTTLAAAQAWYPGARIKALTMSVSNAALQHCLTTGKTVAGAGVIRLNEPIRYFTGAELIGAGGTDYATSFVFEPGCPNGMTHRQTDVVVPANPTAVQIAAARDEVYKSSMNFAKFACFGGSIVVANNTFAQHGTTGGNAAVFDATKSGFYLPKRVADLNLNEAQDAAPLMYTSRFEEVVFERWLGHGIHADNMFSSSFTKCNCTSNKGFGFFFRDGNSVLVRDMYTGNDNSQGGVWAIGGGQLTDCNGGDHFDDVRPYLVGGEPGSVQAVNLKVTNGNLEGCSRLIDLHGNASSLTIDNSDLQWHLVVATKPIIRVHGGLAKITYNPKSASYSSSSPIKTKPDNLITINGAGGFQLEVLNNPKFGSEELTFEVVDSSGSPNAYGYGKIPIRKTTQSFVGGAGYGEYITSQNQTVMKRLLVGKGQDGVGDMAAIGTVDITTLSPTTAAKAGIYINTNVAATRANKVFIKVGDDAAGWTAL